MNSPDSTYLIKRNAPTKNQVLSFDSLEKFLESEKARAFSAAGGMDGTSQQIARNVGFAYGLKYALELIKRHNASSDGTDYILEITRPGMKQSSIQSVLTSSGVMPDLFNKLTRLLRKQDLYVYEREPFESDKSYCQLEVHGQHGETYITFREVKPKSDPEEIMKTVLSITPELKEFSQARTA